MQAVAGAGAPAGLARPGWGARTALPDAVHAEWTKLRTLAGTWWLLAAAVAVTIAVGVAVAGDRRPAVRRRAPPARRPTRPGSAWPASTLGQAIVALLAVLAVGGEYGTGMIRVTLAATPRRLTMLAAKAVVVTGGARPPGPSPCWRLGAGRAADPARPGAVRGERLPRCCPWRTARPARRGGSVLYLVLIALLALGVTTAVRDSAVGDRPGPRPALPVPDRQRRDPGPDLARHLEQLAPMTAGLYIQATAGLRPSRSPRGRASASWPCGPSAP